jgi:Lon protease-like protein
VSQILSLFPLDVVLFPGAPLPLHIFEERYKEMIGECLAKKTSFGVVRAKENALAEIGCTAEIDQVLKKYEDGRMDILSEGVRRFEIIELNHDRSFVQADVLLFEDSPETPSSGQQRTKALELHQSLIEITGSESPVVKDDRSAENDQLSFYLAHELPVDLEFKQTLLGMRSENERMTTLIEYYENIIPKLRRVIRGREKASTNGHAV